MHISQIKTIKRMINALCADEYNELLKTMKLNKRAINEAADAIHKILFRERKQKASWVKYGKTAQGRQRYLDKDSGKTVSISKNSIVRYTKKSYNQWHTYIKYMLYGLTLKEIAFEVGISVTTAFNWRHKILEAMKDYQDDNMLNGEVQVDETYFLLNMKGPWKNKDMPRKAKKRGTPSKYRGTSSEQVCVLSGMDGHDRMMTRIIGQGNPHAHEIYDGLTNKVAGNSTIITDSKQAYKDVASLLNCDLIQIPSGKHRKGLYNLGMTNQYHSELKQWFKQFKGVSTKHLEGYLAWFRFMKLLKYQSEQENHQHETFNYTIANQVTMTYASIPEKPWPIDIYKPYQHLS